MPTRKFSAAAVFALALLTVTAPAHAATIDYLAADVSLNFPSNIFSPLTGLPTTLTGDIQLQLYDSPPAPFPTDYRFTGNFSLGPYSLFTNPNYGFVPGIPPQDGVPNSLYLFGTVGVPAQGVSGILTVNGANLPNLSFAAFSWKGVSPISGTVKITDELTTPLPDALPMFGAALLALVGFAAWQSRRTACG